MQTISMDGRCLKNCLLVVLNGKKNMFKFNEDFIKSYDESSDKGYILEVDVEYSKNLHHLHSNLPFLPERMTIISATSLYVICMMKKAILFI